MFSNGFDKKAKLLITGVLVASNLTLTFIFHPQISRLYIWNLDIQMCVQQFEAHADNIDSLFQTADPYKFCSSSAGEIVIKLWDLYDIVPHPEPQEPTLTADR